MIWADTLREWCRELGQYGPVVDSRVDGMALMSRDRAREVEFKGSRHGMIFVLFRGGPYLYSLRVGGLGDQTKEMALRWVLQGLR